MPCVSTDIKKTFTSIRDLGELRGADEEISGDIKLRDQIALVESLDYMDDYMEEKEQEEDLSNVTIYLTEDFTKSSPVGFGNITTHEMIYAETEEDFNKSGDTDTTRVCFICHYRVSRGEPVDGAMFTCNKCVKAREDTIKAINLAPIIA